MWEVMFWPIVACVLLPWLLVYLGLHVVQRGIIFIDIAMAQMAALGICVAILFRLELESWTTFAHRAGIHISRCCNFFSDRQANEPGSAGSGHRNCICRRSGYGGALTQQGGGG